MDDPNAEFSGPSHDVLVADDHSDGTFIRIAVNDFLRVLDPPIVEVEEFSCISSDEEFEV